MLLLLLLLLLFILGTHGSGIKYGNMASYVTKLELVTGNGEIITLHSNDSADPSLFSAAQV